MTHSYDEQQTAALLPYPELVDTLSAAVVEYAAGNIESPERLVVPLQAGGVMLSMPATAADIAIHKLVNVCPGNRAQGMPTIHGQVTAYDSTNGQLLFSLDGPTVTGRRTAAISALGIRSLARSAKSILLIGTGKQASNHAEAFAALFPDAVLYVKGSSMQSAARFAAAHAGLGSPLMPLEGDVIPEDIDVVVTLTTSKTPVYRDAARLGRLVVGVGAFTPDAAEIAASIVHQSAIFVDDPLGAKHEAGDLIQANVDWNTVGSLAAVIEGSWVGLPDQPIVFKSVGCAAWDLAAARLARHRLSGV
ncbi:bifunctional Delta(1)-pyrroline-2-carboxylate/Delta(1)-piperideine-2-carboxylate reductase [Burkholderia sp. S171]|uniref:bifunctional Delta(1)-pyrroline-2-carboxylate/Delta(1)-piperideine-2- carboxylate reductase n=1 Tax=Burkholderia sp. S171 TaxID=1641860 RepID=UPI0020B1389A|nr:bifunctional Delta(1)-pyrroline-2-carboxylate/Delta(1)-piperideine-2-carboxylate reductase [Burkholderia sp. S171]